LSNDLEEIVSDILRVAESSFDIRDIEPRLRALLSLLESSSARHEEFANALVALLAPVPNELPLGQPGIVEILEFCMRKLRWPEVREALQELKSCTTDWRVRRAAERVLEAYEDDWTGGDLYDTYREG
jgi:hypothetical protein